MGLKVKTASILAILAKKLDKTLIVCRVHELEKTRIETVKTKIFKKGFNERKIELLIDKQNGRMVAGNRD